MSNPIFIIDLFQIQYSQTLNTLYVKKKTELVYLIKSSYGFSFGLNANSRIKTSKKVTPVIQNLNLTGFCAYWLGDNYLF